IRSSPVFSETSASPSFLRTTPARKPRTEWGCQPVAFMIVAMVAPCRRLSIAITRACFEFVRPRLARCGIGPLLGLVGFLGRRLRAAFVDLDGRKAAPGDTQRERPILLVTPPDR